MEDHNNDIIETEAITGVQLHVEAEASFVHTETSLKSGDAVTEGSGGNAVITDALIANDEGESGPAGEEETSDEASAQDLERQDEEEQLPGLDDETDEGNILPADEADSAADPDQPIDPKSLVEVVGVRFRTAGKAYYFAVGNLPVKRGTHVIVETARGLEYGTSVCDPMQIDRKRFKAPVKRIIRIAAPADDRRVQENRKKEREAYKACFEKIREHRLDMKLIDAEYTFDRSKILFYFTSDGRVDFRDLVKDLAGIFHTRIELRQIGVRDETKILGGYGICGRPLCCHTYLADFVPVSIKMAKEQNLSLNPTKISGLCGRLMCCLKNEEDTYEELNKNLPRLGDEVQGSDGLSGEVASVNILKQTVRILVEVDDEKELHEYPADQITILRRRKRGQAKPKINRAELKTPGSRPGMRRADRPSDRKAETEEKKPDMTAVAATEQRTDNDTAAAVPERENISGEGSRRGDNNRRNRNRRDYRRTDRGRPESGDSRNTVQNGAGSRPETERAVREDHAEREDRGGQTGDNRNVGRRPYRKRYSNRRGSNDRRRAEQSSETK